MKKGMRAVPLKEVCLDFIVPQRDKPTAFDGDIPWCRIEDIEGRYLHKSKSGQNVTKELAEKMNMHLCPKGTVISACSASIGKQAITTTDCYTNQTFIGLVANPELLYNVYLYYFLESQTQNLLKLGQGATIKYISKDKYKKMQIPLPSLSEQQRIVKRLDAAFAHIDQLKANSEKQLSEARTLFQKALSKAMEPKEGWGKDVLNKVFNFIDYRGATPTKIQAGVPLVTAKNVKFGYLDYTIKDFISREEFETRKSRGISHKGDLLFTTEAPLGNVAIADLEEFSAGQRLITLQQYDNPQYEILNEFYYYFMLCPDFQNRIKELATGATAQGIKAKILKTVTVPIPPLSEQQRIVARLDSLSAHVRELEEINKKLIAECDALKQTLLRKVFE